VLLQVYLDKINALARSPHWYNALTQNCTTSIRLNAMQGGAIMPLDWRFLLNGHLDELLYEQGRINHSLPLAEIRRRSDVTARAQAAGTNPDFSRRIREGLPARPDPAQVTAASSRGASSRYPREIRLATSR
jgi:hypothetical protein